jgi:hypothetical protein
LVALPLVVAAIAWVMMPIVSYDTDIWYHLADGRKIVQTGEIPHTLDFSFLAQREWVDYFWGFQALLYTVFDAFGFGGLIGLRAVLFVAVLGCITALLWPAGVVCWRSWLATAAVVSCYAVILGPRYHLVRPHTVSYLLIVVVLYITTRRPKWVLALPLVALVWVNVHGVTFPVLLLCLGSLFADQVVGRVKDPGGSQRTEPLLAVLLGAAAVLATPAGSALLPLPFADWRFAAGYIEELGKQSLGDIFGLNFEGLGLSQGSALTVVGAMAVAGLWRLRGRWSSGTGALVLAAGGLVLFLRGHRFGVDFSLLLLPLIRVGLGGAERWTRGIVTWVVALVWLSGCAAVWKGAEAGRWAGPVAPFGLPQGAVEYLKRDPLPGTVMNPPTVGGYLLWALPPRFQFAMDMKVPIVFTDQDFFLADGFYWHGPILDRVIAEHDPTYVMLPLSSEPSLRRLRQRAPEYSPVFFDDTVVLFADLQQRPGARVLESIDPYRLDNGESIPEFDGETSVVVSRELNYLLSIHPTGLLTNQLKAILATRAARFEEAERAARAVIAVVPGGVAGWLLLGDARSGLGELDRAIEAYRHAERVASAAERPKALRSLAIALARAGKSAEAYRTMVEFSGWYNPEVSLDDLELLGGLAVEQGDLEAGAKVLELVLLRSSPEDRSRVDRVRKVLADLSALTAQ